MSSDGTKFRIGSVNYLNAVPLTRGIEGEIIFATPAKLAEMLRRDELDAALVSITEVLLNDRYDILDGIAIASLGEVYSVLLAHHKPLAEVKEIFCDTGVAHERESVEGAAGRTRIEAGIQAAGRLRGRRRKRIWCCSSATGRLIFSARRTTHEIFDLGTAWYELTNLPFVYAVWALRRGIENKELRRELREAKSFGMETLDYIIETREEYDEDFRRDYLGWHIHFHLGRGREARHREILRTAPKARPRPGVRAEVCFVTGFKEHRASDIELRTLNGHTFDVRCSAFNVRCFRFQPRQRFRIAHVHPAALDFQSGQLLSAGDHGADGVGQFVFAARRFLQSWP